MMRDPGDLTLSLRPPRPQLPAAAAGRAASVYMIILFLMGALLAGMGLIIFLTQGHQIQVTAKVLSERCHPRTDATTGQLEARCDADVKFTAMNGQVIRTKITDAFPSEFSGTGQSRTIGLRYDSSDPTQPFKQATMSVTVLVMTLAGGAAVMLTGGWGFRWFRRIGPRRGNGTISR